MNVFVINNINVLMVSFTQTKTPFITLYKFMVIQSVMALNQ